jgi:DNA-binding CsgD family transcriptional regulator
VNHHLVKAHLSRAYAELGVANRTELARLAATRGATDGAL